MPQWLLIVSSHRAPNKPQRPTLTGFLDNRFSTPSRSWCQPPFALTQSQVERPQEQCELGSSSPSQLSGGQDGDCLDQTKAQPRGTRPQSRARNTAAPEGGPLAGSQETQGLEKTSDHL
jgi:hypothetical protein